ncbi:MAG: ATP-binding protein [Magnetococcales bacterium]|nr:ATP-binding protein [Magnetococcales bacterium]
MLNRILFNQFRSYQKAILHLAPLTLLLGAGGSGKSNAIEGVRLLSWMAQGKGHIQKSNPLVRGRLHDLAYHTSSRFGLACSGTSPQSELQMGLMIEIREDAGLHLVYEHLKENDKGDPFYQAVQGKNGDLLVEYNPFDANRKKPRISLDDQNALFTQLDSPAKLHPDRIEARERIPVAAGLIRHWLSNILFLDPVLAGMRGYRYKNERQLLADGSNLSSVLFHLWGGDKAEEELTLAERANRTIILNFIRIMPGQEHAFIDFLTAPRGEVIVRIRETYDGQTRAFDASLFPDTTLRLLAMAAALLSCPVACMVVIEDIDNTITPSQSAKLLEQIAALAESRSLRVLLTGHNPATLEALPDNALVHTLLCYRDCKNGSSRLVRLQDISDHPGRIAQGPISHLMTAGVLERFANLRLT